MSSVAEQINTICFVIAFGLRILIISAHIFLKDIFCGSKGNFPVFNLDHLSRSSSRAYKYYVTSYKFHLQDFQSQIL